MLPPCTENLFSGSDKTNNWFQENTGKVFNHFQVVFFSLPLPYPKQNFGVGRIGVYF